MREQRIYRATACLASGAQIQHLGTLARCIAWSEEVMRANGGDISISIRDTGERIFDDKD